MVNRAILRCGGCGFKVTVTMPRVDKIRDFICDACGFEYPLLAQDCCIFCRYGHVACPEKQK